MTDIEEIPGDELVDAPLARWTDEDRRAVLAQLIAEHLQVIDRRVREVRTLVGMLT